MELPELERRASSRQTLPPPETRRALREAAHLSLVEVADYVGVASVTVWYWEQGRYSPARKHLPRYLDALAMCSRVAE